MPIELAGVKLEKIHKISTTEHADFVYHSVVGMQGSLAQNIGRGSVHLKIEGICYGAKAKADIEKIRGFYIKRKPVDFIADIVGKSYVSKALLDSFYVTESAEEPGQFSYTLVIAEYVEEKKKSDGKSANKKAGGGKSAGDKTTGSGKTSKQKGGQKSRQKNVSESSPVSGATSTIENPVLDAKIKGDALKKFNLAKLPNMLGSGELPELSNPFEPLNGVMSPVKEAGTALADTLKGLKELIG